GAQSSARALLNDAASRSAVPAQGTASAQRFLLGLDGGQDHLDADILAQGGVDAQVVVVHVAPAVLGVVVVVGGPLAVGLVDLVPDALFGGGLDDGVGLGVFPPPLQGRVDKDVQHVGALPQHIVGAAAQD